MQQLWSNVISGIIGGAVVLGALFFWQNSQPVPVHTESIATARQVSTQVQIPIANITNPTFDFKEAARIATPVVVHISASSSSSASRNPLSYFFNEESPYSSPGGSSGSGVIYSHDGYIITNHHVVKGAESLMVTLSDNRKFEAKLIGINDKTDLAVIKIEASGLPTLEIANSDEIEVGEWVLAVGNPLDLTSTVTAGIVSAKGRSLELLPDRDAIEAFIQTDAAVNPGNSGGALIDANGKFLGINTAIATRNGMFQGYSFAIPINLVTRIVDDILEFGSYQRAFMGVVIYPLDAEAASELGIDINQGVVVDELVDGGSAQYAGILPKDIIIKVNDRDIRNVPELTEIVGRAKTGDLLQVKVFRRGKEVDIPVRMRGQK